MIRSFVTALVFMTTMAFSAKAYAQCTPGIPCTSYSTDSGQTDVQRGEVTTCNGDVMNQMVARAFLEAQRETLLNETYIRKADSVLEYSCFDQLAGMTTQHAAPLFSETQDFMKAVPLNIIYEEAADGTYQNNPPVAVLMVNMGTGHMQPNMQAAVTQGLQSYISSNFGHEFLGGDGGSDYSASGGGSYNCSYMNQVFMVAHCVNLPSDPFPSFADLVSSDPRQLPEACSGGTQITQDIINVARNPAPDYQYAAFDIMEVHWDMFEVDGPSCPSDPIPVGAMATIHGGTQTTPDPATNPAGFNATSAVYEEHICPNPGCWYDATSGQCSE